MPVKSTRNMASFLASASILAEALHLPEDHRIIGAEWCFVTQAVRIFIEGPNLPPCLSWWYRRKNYANCDSTYHTSSRVHVGFWHRAEQRR